MELTESVEFLNDKIGCVQDGECERRDGLCKVKWKIRSKEKKHLL